MSAKPSGRDQDADPYDLYSSAETERRQEALKKFLEPGEGKENHYGNKGFPLGSINGYEVFFGWDGTTVCYDANGIKMPDHFDPEVEKPEFPKTPDEQLEKYDELLTDAETAFASLDFRATLAALANIQETSRYLASDNIEQLKADGYDNVPVAGTLDELRKMLTNLQAKSTLNDEFPTPADHYMIYRSATVCMANMQDMAKTQGCDVGLQLAPEQGHGESHEGGERTMMA